MRATVPRGSLGELSRTTEHGGDEVWEPTLIEIVAYYGPPEAPRRGKHRRVEITAEQIFGRGAYGAPMDGAALLAIIDRLRKPPPKKVE